MKTIAKVLLTFTALASFVGLFAEASNTIGQLLVSGGSILTFWLSYKGLDKLGMFE